ncbi:MAG: sulfatase-like hydrolase/transferase [Candidatus Hydrogenedentes bacterium]|nr:sulfatase-like hydrolase/transferase [Candidatus Hydrogenedentota bacterium]
MNRRRFIEVGASIGMAAGLSRPSQAKKRPNVLLLFADQHNARIMGCDGHPEVKTPNFDRLAQEGVRFARTYCQDGICIPSRNSLMTSQYPRTLGMFNNTNETPYPDRWPTMAKTFHANGYFTAGVGKHHMKNLDGGWDWKVSTLPPSHCTADEYYLDWIADRGQLDAYEGDSKGGFNSPLFSHVSKLKPENTVEAFTASKAIEALGKASKSGKPFFVWCSFQRPHQPYTPPKLWADMYDPARITLPASIHEPADHLPPHLNNWRNNPRMPWCGALAAKDETMYRRFIAYYYSLVTEIDHHIGTILDELDRLSLRDNTIIIYTSDHGDFVGYHGMWEKCALGHNIYEDTLRVPLIFNWPAKIKPGRTRHDLVELVDLFPTVPEFTGITLPKNHRLVGRSLVPTLLNDTPVGRDYVISENWSQTTVITDRYKLGTWVETAFPNFDFRKFGDMMFDRERDPLELDNVRGKKGYDKIETKLRGYIAEFESNVSREGRDINYPKSFPARFTKQSKQKPKKT